jgi:hypothetical protein
VVEWGALEKRCGREVTVGSNPTLSAEDTQLSVFFVGTAAVCQNATIFNPQILADMLPRNLPASNSSYNMAAFRGR